MDCQRSIAKKIVDSKADYVITVNNASGNRVFTYPGQVNNNWLHTQNQVSLHYRNINTASETFNINANGRYSINKSEVVFALDATKWTNSSINSLMSNTWAEWKNIVVKLFMTNLPMEHKADFILNPIPILLKESYFRLYTKAGTGLSRFVDDTNQETIKPSGALEISLQGNWSKYQWRTSNYISSPYFPGIKRGVFSTDNRINRRFKKSIF